MVYALVSPEQLQLPAGAVVRLPATWQDYQALLRQRGDRALPRLKYRQGEVLIMAPLPVHGRDVSLMADIVKTLLDHNNQDYDSFTPVTMELPEESGIEPDYCFYIDNWQAVSGKRRIDWQADPPPDLVIEIDVTSFSDVDDYLPYRVPEIWLSRQQQLVVYQLQQGRYIPGTQSRYFPNLDLITLVAQCFKVAYDRNTSTAIRNLRQSLTTP